MKSRSAKNKGARLQRMVRDLIMAKFPHLRPGDVESIGMGQKGCDIVLSPTAKDLIPFDIECKNREQLNVWSALQQAHNNTEEGRSSLLVFKRNRSDIYCALKLEDLLELLA